MDVAIAIEQVSIPYTRYNIQLRLPSGGRQTIAVTAPPGGFELEVRDMTGDDIRNDLVLTPALLPSFPTVLVNDGDDHFTVASFSTTPGSLGPGRSVSWSAGNLGATTALISPGFKAGGHAKNGGLFIPP